MRQWTGSGSDFVVGTGSNQEITLEWTNPNKSNILYWDYRQKAEGGNWGNWSRISTDPNTASHTFTTTLTSGIRHYYQVRAAVSGEVTHVAAGLKAWAKIGSNWNKQSHVARGLAHNVLYNFQVRAVNLIGIGDAGSTTARPVAGSPGKPTLTSAAGGDEQVTLTWTKNAGGKWVDKWQYQYKTTGSYGNWTDVAASTDSTRTATVTGLDNGKTYTFKVRGFNAAGGGAASASLSASTQPAAPAGFTAVAKTDKTPVALYTEGHVVLSWTNPNNSTITKWQYQYKSKPAGGQYGAYGDWTDMSDSTAATTTYTVTKLTHGTSYKFKIRAVNATGNGDASVESSEVTPELPTPDTPTGFTATAMDEAVMLKWTDPGNSSITKWQYRQKEGSNNYGDWTDVPSSTASTTSYTVPSLTNETTYKFKIRAVNAAGEGTVSDERSATPLPVPAQPTNLTATPSKSGSGQATLRWDRHDDGTIIKWQYQYKAASSGNYGSWRDVPNSGPATTSYTRTGLHHNVLYDFQVRAVNAIGNGMPSSTSARPVAGKPGAPPTFTATTYNNASTKLTWNKHSGGRWVDKWQYSTDNGSTWADVQNSGDGTRTATITKTSKSTPTTLVNGTPYSLKLRGVNAAGNGAASTKVDIIPLARPSKPTGLTAAGGDGKATLSWTATYRPERHGLRLPVQALAGGQRQHGGHTRQRPSHAEVDAYRQHRHHQVAIHARTTAPTGRTSQAARRPGRPP